MNKKQEKFEEINNHLLNDVKPSEYMNQILNDEIFKNEFPFTLLSNLKNVEQSPTHHPEGSVWNHTLMVVDNASKMKNKSEDIDVFMWSALLHDIGKTDATKIKNGKITAYNHDKIGSNQVIDFLKVFIIDKNFIKKVSNMVRWHMQILYVVKNLPFANINEMKKQVSLDEIALLGLCDRLGRGGNVNLAEEEENIAAFLKKCRNN